MSADTSVSAVDYQRNKIDLQFELICYLNSLKQL